MLIHLVIDGYICIYYNLDNYYYHFFFSLPLFSLCFFLPSSLLCFNEAFPDYLIFLSCWKALECNSNPSGYTLFLNIQPHWVLLLSSDILSCFQPQDLHTCCTSCLASSLHFFFSKQQSLCLPSNYDSSLLVPFLRLVMKDSFSTILNSLHLNRLLSHITWP